MNELKDTPHRLRQALKAVYDTRTQTEEPIPGDTFDYRVMQRIRNVNTDVVATDGYAMFNEFVCRLVPVSAVLIICLTACLFQFDFVSELEITAMLGNDSMGFGLDQVFDLQTG